MLKRFHLSGHKIANITHALPAPVYRQTDRYQVQQHYLKVTAIFTSSLKDRAIQTLTSTLN